jgi:dipeptidyl aminopeptidase/acylaminoacyl peptidase
MGGVQYLSRMSWIDTARMGLHGHSFGGYETNYIITHSHLFAAASEGAGLINLIGFYGAGFLSGTATGAAFAERGQFRMGSSLWERPDLYIKNSPVFKIDQVTTPLLIMHNRKDANVPWYHGLELFSSLRRLNKKVWMLQYDGGHIVFDKEALDYTTRLTQFFDHYLKGALPPKWMMEGSPEMKEKATAFDQDSSGIQP